MSRKQVAIRPTKHSIRFQCRARALDDVHYIWLKNGKPFKHIQPSNSVTSKEHVGDLNINNLKVNDGGQYTCVAFNNYGNISFTYELRILCKYLFEEKLKQTIT